jgi:pimeloyl-ACP methyl ester carboxylesterase
VADPVEPEAFTVAADGLELAGEETGPEGTPRASIVLLHGLSATRRYVVHRSLGLPRAGFRLIGFDARGHGESDPAPEGTYDYEHLAADCGDVIARVGERRAVLAGHSMGAHTIAAFALREPDSLAAVVLIGPAVTGEPASEETLAYWEPLADGLERGGVDGFIEAYEPTLEPEWRETIVRFTRERLEAHRHPEAVAQALREIPRSRPFEDLGALESLDVPALVVASRDVADPAHPYAVAEAWAERLPQARLVSEQEGESPLAWQGGRLSRAIAEFCAEDAVRERLGA